MLRSPRIFLEGEVYHAYNRVTRGEKVFGDDHEALSLLYTIREILFSLGVEKYGLKVVIPSAVGVEESLTPEGIGLQCSARQRAATLPASLRHHEAVAGIASPDCLNEYRNSQILVVASPR